MDELANDDEETTTLEARDDLEERIFKRIALKVREENAKMLRSITTSRINNANNKNTSWFRFGSGGITTNGPSDDDPPSAVFQPSQDVYAILATASWRSFPFWFSLIVIFGFQYLLVILLLVNTLGAQDSNNPLNLPPNVEPSVRTSQMMLIVVALFSQGDLLAGIESLVRGLPDHFRGDKRFASMTSLQWRLSSLVQFTQGLLNLLACFVLAIQAETVSDVLLNVLGVAFISDLDELAFRLCLKGYFGGSMKAMSNDVCVVHFHRITPNIGALSVPSARRKIKKDGHIISAFAVLLLTMAAFGYLAFEQYSGTYLEQHIRIEFGDEVLPFLGLFNGCYQTSKSGTQIDGRLVYEQVGYSNGGKFGFCSDFEDEGESGWSFFIGNKEEDEICKKENYILRSGETETFSLLEAGKTKWYTNDDLPMDYLEITEIKSSASECGQSMFEDSKDSCPSILAFDTMATMTKLVPPAKVDTEENGLDAAVSHPIYFLQNSGNENGTFALVFFTGRRWVNIKSDHIIGLGNETNVDAIKRFFFSSGGGLSTIIDQLRTSGDEEVEWVSSVSEIVDTTRDQGSPLGLLWYFPRYKEIAASTETGNLVRNFPSANLARPIDSVWTCDFCDDDTNPCLYGGICDAEEGTCASCKHGTSGRLCQILPLGNGICNLYFNTPEYNYDGGDCCAGTCKGVDCGKDDLPDPFSTATINTIDANGSWNSFPGNTEWKEIFRGREFAFGVDITDESLEFVETSSPRRFNHCIDANTVLLTIQLEPEETVYLIGRDQQMQLADTTVQCDGTQYLRTPRFVVDNNTPNPIFREEIRVPYGAQCEFRFNEFDFGVNYIGNISIIAENRPVPFLQRTVEREIIYSGNTTSISLGIPKSKCIWDVFVEYLVPPDLTEVEYAEFTNGVDVESLCNDDRRGELLDQYAVWKVVKPPLLAFGKANGEVYGYNLMVDGPVCTSVLVRTGALNCKNNRVSALDFPALFGGEAGPPEIWRGIVFLTQIESLDLSYCNFRSMPTAIGKLELLTSLVLDENQLESIPSELGLLTSLSRLSFPRNKLTWLPSEIGNLGSLTALNLDFNPMTRDSLPIEVQDLELGGELQIDVCPVFGGGSEYGCLDACTDDESWESFDSKSGSTYNCQMYSSYGYCPIGDIWGELDVDPDVSGIDACCICGGGTTWNQ